MNRDINCTGNTCREPGYKLDSVQSTEQSDSIPLAQFRDVVLQSNVPVSTSNFGWKEIIKINKCNTKPGKLQDNDHNWILRYRSVCPGDGEAACVKQITSDWHLDPRGSPIISDTRDQEEYTWIDFAAHSPRRRQVPCPSSTISGDLKREQQRLKTPGGKVYVSSCSDINTFQLFSNDILSKKCLVESEKALEPVSNKPCVCCLSLCDGIHCSTSYITTAESQTQHSDLSAGLQCNTSFSSLDIYRSPESCSYYGDNSSDETLKYRKDLREQCKRHHNLKLYNFAKHEPTIKNTFVLKDIDNLGFPSYVLTPQGTHSGGSKPSGNLHGKTRKNRHRKKHEIGSNPVSRNKATTLRPNTSETGDALKPGAQNKDFSKVFNSKLCLPRLPDYLHKESPRARFERDRAARNNAIAGKSCSTQNNVTAFCIKQAETVRYSEAERCTADHIDSVFFDSTQLKCLASTQQSSFENRSSHVNKNTNLNGSYGDHCLRLSSFTSTDGLAKIPRELCQIIPDTDNKYHRYLQSIFTSKTGLLDSSKKAVVDDILHGKSVIQKSSVCAPREENSRDQIENIDETTARVGERVTTRCPVNIAINSHAPLSDRIRSVNNNCIQNSAIETHVKLNSVFHSINHEKCEDSAAFRNLSVRNDDRANNNSCKYRLEQRSLPAILTQPSLQRKTADCLSSTFSGSDISPAFRNTDTWQNKNISEINESQINKRLSHLKHLNSPQPACDFNSVQSRQADVDTSVVSRECPIDNCDSSIIDRLNANIKSHNQPPTSNVCIIHRYPESVKEEHLDQITQFINDLFREENAENCEAVNYTHAVKKEECAECQTESNKLSVTTEAAFKCDSASNKNTCREISSVDNTCVKQNSISPHDSKQITNLTKNNSPAISSINNYRSLAKSNTAGKRMLASRGLRIYDYVNDANVMLSPTKQAHLKSTSTSAFQWEGIRYLILPTLVDSLGNTDTSKVATIASADLLTQRSVSHTDVTTQPIVNTTVKSNSFFTKESDTDNNFDDDLLSRSSRNKRLSFKQRSLSVDVLCAEDAADVRFSSMKIDPLNISEDNISAGRGYVEWKTCSNWLRQPDMENKDGTDSRGYVEWDTIWTAAPPCMSEGKDNEHLYDSVGDYNLYSCDTNVSDSSCEELHNLAVITETPPCENFHSLPVTTETPPALPERTYISRLKQSSRADLSPSCVEMQTSNHQRHQHHRHHHHHHHDSSNLRRYHNHIHHTHTSNQKHKEHRSAASSTSALKGSPNQYSPAVFSKQCTHISGSLEKGLLPQTTNHDSNPLNELQNYATVHKLRGYRFNNITPLSERPVPHRSDQTAMSSENYCHLAPLASKESMISLQTGDILDYIDGLHDSMSPKRRENIYILLNNKQTRAKFSESLEIESRLLSKGLISGSSVHEAVEDSLRENGGACAETIQAVFKFKVPQRKGATVPVSSTYV